MTTSEVSVIDKLAAQVQLIVKLLAAMVVLGFSFGVWSATMLFRIQALEAQVGKASADHDLLIRIETNQKQMADEIRFLRAEVKRQ